MAELTSPTLRESPNPDTFGALVDVAGPARDRLGFAPVRLRFGAVRPGFPLRITILLNHINILSHRSAFQPMRRPSARFAAKRGVKPGSTSTACASRRARAR